MKQLAEETGTLLRQEVELAKAELLEKLEAVRAEAADRAARARGDVDSAKRELAENGKQAGIGAGMLGGAAAVGLIALGVLAALLVRALDSAMPLWVALLLVLLLYLGVTGTLAWLGLERLRAASPIIPSQSLQRLVDD